MNLDPQVLSGAGIVMLIGLGRIASIVSSADVDVSKNTAITVE